MESDMKELTAQGCEIRDEEDNLIAQTYGGASYLHCTDLTYNEAIAMATRLAAVNDMYLALRGLFEVLSFDDKYMHLDEVKSAEAALAKVDGENND